VSEGNIEMSIFREYDVRGLADRELNDKLCWALGRALAERVKASGDSRAYVGRDVRLSSPRISASLAAGFEAGGVKTRIQAPGPTPLLYFCAHEAVADFPTKSGVMVTGSHNPPEYNGFKMVIGGKTLFGDDIQKLRGEVESFLDKAPAKVAGDFEACDRSEDYIDYLRRTLKIQRKIKVVVDAGNGAAGPLAVDTYRALGCEVIPLFCDPDGRFPNHHPDPTVPKNLEHLIAKVKETGAELGIGFDGDGDRIGAVSGTGRILFGDHLVLYYARDILKEIPGATVISEVKSSQVLYDTLAKWGAKGILWKTGHSLIKAKLKETHAALAGEMSGHMFFAHRFFGFDDAVYAGARLLEGLSQRPETLDAFLDSLPPAINTPEIRVDCDDNKKFGVVERFTRLAKEKWGAAAVNDIDGARVKLHGGWGLLRASNTQPVLVLRFEAPDQKLLKQVRDDFAGLLASVDPEVRVP
jgi:phosphomannomutase/phosphoglucomutase